MNGTTKLLVSHAPFWHIGSSVAERNYNNLIAALPAALMGVSLFGVPALAVLCMSVSSAVLWELIFIRVAKRPDTVADGHAALIGLIFGLLLPATAPYWLVITGTFVAIVIGKQIFGGIGANPFNPAALAYAILLISWGHFLDLDVQLANYSFNFKSLLPLGALKAFGVGVVESYRLTDLLLGRQIGSIGSVSGLAIILGGIYLIARGFVRWEIPISFIAGVFITAGAFHLADPARFAGPLFHLLAGYTLLGAFFLAPEDSSSPVNTIPMLIYGAAGGVLVMLIRNIGAYPDGVVQAVLVINLINPLIDKIRPKALGKAARL